MAVVASTNPAGLVTSRGRPSTTHHAGARAGAAGAALLVWAAIGVTAAGRVAPVGGWRSPATSLAWIIAAAALAALVIGLARRNGAGLPFAAAAATAAALRAGLDVGPGPVAGAESVDLLRDAAGYIAIAGATWTAVASGPRPRATSDPDLAPQRHLGWLLGVTAGSLVVTALLGAAVRAFGAAWACGGFPECSGQGPFAFGQTEAMDLHLAHRLSAYVSVGLVGFASVTVARARRQVPALRVSTRTLSGLVLLQAALGALSVNSGVPPALEIAHALVGAGALAAMTAAAALAWETRSVPVPEIGSVTTRPLRMVLGAYVDLTKPKVMSLLLTTTLGAMVMAEGEWPPFALVFWTLLGGALMSGGAGAINHYLDRDIDPLMGRTAKRPIPSGVIRPASALLFGTALAMIAFVVLATFVNVLAAVLSFMGFVGYVFVYTIWLKRTTPSNIVIGGAAGAIPPLVGWAAVTNDVSLGGVSLTAWYLFAIVFFWTPPHFWALSLMIKQHYERAKIPMLPVIRGDAETRWQILLYSVLLVALSLVLAAFQLMGMLYFVSAIGLGAVFLYYAVRLWRDATLRAAKHLYLYSMLYLALLFVAMAVDRVVARAALLA